jgi:arylsulfatase A-like enzyme
MINTNMKWGPVIPTLFLLVVACGTGCQQDQSGGVLPNIVLILADDLGYGDLGIYGQKKIRTPHLDKMASEGLIFMNHYSGSTVCAPSRASLLTGFHTGHASVRGNRGFKSEGQYSLPEEDFTIAEMLKKAGYRTGAFGKWGLGYIGEEGDPNNQGFDEFFGYNCQRQAHRYYPKHLWHNNRKIILEGNDGEHTRVYAHDLIHEKALKFMEDSKEEPFFLFLPYIIPHLELIVPEDEIFELYKGKFPETPYEGVPGSAYGTGWIVSKYCPQEWPHATYAAMVSRLDLHVGEILDKLKKLGLSENTLVIFTSDNGPDFKGGADPDFFNSSGGFRGYKRDLYEGGIRVPMIAWWPDRIKPGKCHHLSAFWDVMPTLAELTEIESSFMTDGISFLPTLFNSGQQEKHSYLYWELASDGLERQAILKDNWKYIKIKSDVGISNELYRLSDDPEETVDLSLWEPGILKELDARLHEAHSQNDDFPLSIADE